MDILFNYISALLWGILIGLILSGFVMYIAHKIINAGYKIKYCSKSIVYHSHNLTLKQTYNRYKDL